MTRLEKCELLKSKGYTYDPDTGKIYSVKGNEIIGKHTNGYIHISIKYYKKQYRLLGHHFAWYMIYGNVDFIELDHINRIRFDNRISNLRIVNRLENQQNKNGKGYYWCNDKNKWRSQITINKKKKHLGYFNTEEEAQNAYIEAKNPPYLCGGFL